MQWILYDIVKSLRHILLWHDLIVPHKPRFLCLYFGRDILSLGNVGAVNSNIKPKAIIQKKIEYTFWWYWEFNLCPLFNLLCVFSVYNSLVTNTSWDFINFRNLVFLSSPNLDSAVLWSTTYISKAFSPWGGSEIWEI